MSDNTIQTGSDTIRTEDRSGVKTQIFGLDVDPGGTESLMSPSNPAPVGLTGSIALTSTSGNISTGSTGTIGPLTVTTQNIATFIAKNQTAGSAWTGNPVLVFEQSDDGTSWSPLMVTRDDNNWTASTHTLPAGASDVEYVFNAAIEAIQEIRCRVTTGPSTNPMTVVIQAGPFSFTPQTTVIPQRPAIQHARVTGTTTESSQTLVSAPGAGFSIYVTDVVAGNSGTALTLVQLQDASGPTIFLDLPIAGGGGGAAVSMAGGPYKLTANNALQYSIGTATTTWYVNVFYYIAP